MKDIKEITGELDKSEGIQVLSTDNYYDIFSNCSNKPHIDIPSTVLVKDNEVKEWLFTSKNEQRKILKKSEDKRNLREMYNAFAGIRIDDYSLSELRELPDKQFCAIVHFANHDKFLVNCYELKYIIENSIDKVRKIQQVIDEYQPRKYQNPINMTNETLYCFIRREDEQAPLTFKYFKKAVHYDTLKDVKPNTMFEPFLGPTFQNQQFDLTNMKAFLLNRKYSSKTVGKVYYKMFDTNMNQKLEKISRKVVEFIENEYRIPVQHFFMKFLVDSTEKVLFMGGRDLTLFPLRARPSLDESAVEQINRGGSITLKDLIQEIGYPYPQKLYIKKIELPTETIKVFSDKLFYNMIVQSCSGEFCKYNIMLHHSLLDRKDDKLVNEIPNKCKAYGKLQSKNLPYKLPYALIKNVFDYKDSVVEVLQKHKIYPPSFMNNDHAPRKQDYDFKAPRTLPNNQNLYSMNPVCSKCLQIYTLLSKEIQKLAVTKDMTSPSKEKKWVHSEVRLKNNLKSSECLYPPVKSTDAIEVSSRETEANIHHNVGLFLLKNQQGRRSIPKSAREIDDVMESPRSPKRAATRQDTRALPKLDMIPMSAKHSETPKLRINDMAPSQFLLKQTAFETPAKKLASGDLLRRMSLGIVSRQESVVSRKSSFYKNTEEVSSDNLQIPSRRGSFAIGKPLSEPQRAKSSFHPSPFDFSEFGTNSSGGTNRDILSAKYASAKKIDFGASTPKKSKSISIEQRDEAKKKLITEIEKNLQKTHKTGSIADDLYRAKKSLYEQKKSDIGVPLSIFHYKHHNTRKIPLHRVTIPKDSIDPESKEAEIMSHPHVVDFATYRKIGKFPKPLLHKDDLENIFGYFHEKSIAVPFMVLDSNDIIPDQPLSVTVICHDMFDNFMSYIGIYRGILSECTNKRLILLNFPCQAFTIFPDDYVPTNEACSEVLDGLLYRLEESGVLDVHRDEFSFIGYGYGGNILLCFLSLVENSIPTYRSLMLINSFPYVDDLLAKSMQEMIRTFEEAPDEIPELPYEFYAYLTQTKNYSDDMKNIMMLNPITKAGRIKMCEGCLDSFNVRKKIANLQMHKTVVHSLNNCLVNVTHADILATNEDERYGTKKNTVVEIYFKKKLVCVQGGHAILKENLEEFSPILVKFLEKGRA